VLSAYGGEDLGKIPTFDILEDVAKRLGFRLSLDHLAEQTLGERKSADGLQAVAWFREGRMEELAAYCQKDVEITRRLFEFGCENGYLLYQTRDGQKVRLPVDWDLERIVSEAGKRQGK
jgi:DEAD/DEAH box helicase domain-containing protein